MDKTYISPTSSQRDTGSEIKELIQTLNQWSKEREQSQKWLDNLLSSYSDTVDKDIDHLIKEICHLRSELSVVTKERNELLDSNKKLGSDVKRQKDRFDKFKNLFEMENEIDVTEDNQEADVETPGANEHSLARLINSTETFDQEKDEEGNDFEVNRIQQQDEYYSNDWVGVNISVGEHTYFNGSTEVKPEPEQLSKGMIGNTEVESDPHTLSLNMVGEFDFNGEQNIDQNEEIPAGNYTSQAVVIPVIKTFKTISRKGIDAEHKETSKHFCQECGYSTNDNMNLDSHIESVHGMGGKKFNCESCHYATDFKVNLKNHTLTKHGAKEHICSDCGSAFSRYRTLRYHMNNVHTTNKERFKCNKCPYTSASKSNLKIHVDRVHEKKKNHVCVECGHAVLSKSDLRKHIKNVHAKIKNHMCRECGFAFARRFSLHTHMESVHKLTIHYTSHDKEDVRDVHEKKLVQSDNVEVPPESHRKQTADKCEECGKVFNTKTGLKQHMMSKHNIGDKKFSCEHCSYAAYYRGHLERHTKEKHEKMKNHTCEQCGYASFLKSNVKKHIETVHKDQK